MNRLLPQNPVLTTEQVERISNILDNAGQVILGVMVFSPLLGGFDKAGIGEIIAGLIGVVSCWLISIVLARRKEMNIYDI